MRSPLIACSLLVALVCPPLVAQETAIKPVLVVSVAPVDSLLGDVDYISKLIGAEDQGRMIRQLAGPILGGIDRTRPWGAYATLSGGDFKPIGFIPVKSLQTQLSILEPQIGKAEELPGGILKVTPPDSGAAAISVYFKEENGWAFYAAQAEHLASGLPKDPVALLGGLEKKYDLGVRIIAENLSAVDRQAFIAQLKEGIAQQAGGASDVPEQWLRSAEEGLLRYAEGAKTIDLGLTVDAQQANVSLAFVVEPIAGSELEKSLASVRSLTTPHSGVLVPGSALVVHRAAKLGPQEIAAWDAFMDQLLKNSVASDVGPQEEAAARESLPLRQRIFKAAHADGNVDWGMSYLIHEDGKVTSLGGVHLAGLKQLEADFRAFYDKHKATDPALSKLTIEWDFARHGPVRIIKLIPPADAQHNTELLGDDPSIFLGIANNYCYTAFGYDGLKHLKAAIDRSAAKPAFKAAPFRMRIDVRPIVKLAAKNVVNDFGPNDPALDQLVRKLDNEQGKTIVNVNVLPSEAGLEGRLEVGEGVVKVLPYLGQVIVQVFGSHNVAGQEADDFGEAISNR